MKRSTVESRAKIALAVLNLRHARDLLKEAGATRAVGKVRLALSSALGAERHAANTHVVLRRQVSATVGYAVEPRDTG